MGGRRAILAVAACLVLIGCGSGRTAPEPTREPTERPTAPPAWALAVTDTNYDQAVSLGDTIEMSVTVSNTGTAANPKTELQMGGMGDYADLIGCIPECEVNELFGDTYAVMPGVDAGAEVTYQVQWLAKALGVADASICVYDNDPAGEQVTCLSGSITIGN